MSVIWIVRGVLGLAAVALLYFCVSTVLSWKEDSAALPGVKTELAQEKEKAVARQKLEAEKERQARTLEVELAKARRAAAKARAERASEYAKKSYRDCVLPVDGLRILQQRRADINAAAPAR